MNRGCIATGDIRCDGCCRIIKDGARYLVREEEQQSVRLCIECCLTQGYATHLEEKGEQGLTFFLQEVSS